MLTPEQLQAIRDISTGVRPPTTQDIRGIGITSTTLLDAQGNPHFQLGTKESDTARMLQGINAYYSRGGKALPDERANQILKDYGFEAFTRAQDELTTLGKVVSGFPALSSSSYATQNPFTDITGPSATPEQIKAQNVQGVPIPGSEKQQTATLPGAQTATQPQVPPVGQTPPTGQPGAPGVASASQPSAVSGTTTPPAGATLASPTPGQASPTQVTDPAVFQLKPGESTSAYYNRINQARGFTASQTSGLQAPTGTPQDATNAQTQADAAVAKANAKTQADTSLQNAGVAPPSPKAFNDNPLQAFSDLYKSLFASFGLSSFKDQMDSIQKELKGVDDKHAEKVALINENPWISEGLRAKKVSAAEESYNTQKGSLVDRAQLFNTKYEQGLDQVKFLSQTALGAYYSDRTLDQNLVLKQMDLAQRQAEVETKGESSPRGNKLTLAEATKFGLPTSLVGMTEEQIGQDLESPVPPSWFKTMIENQLRMSLTSQALQEKWEEFRVGTSQGKTSVGGLDFDSL